MIKSAASKVMWMGRARLFALLLAGMVALVLGYATKAYAAPGDLDSSFGSGGKAITDFGSNRFEAIFDMALQEDGKMVVAGYAESGTTTGRDFLIARFNPNGTLDTSFGSGGSTMFPIGAGSSTDLAWAVAVRPDGKVVVAGYTRDSGGTTGGDLAVARLNADGTPDDTFSGDGKLVNPLNSAGHDQGRDVALQGNKILVAGYTYNGARTSGGTENDFVLLRYDANGNLDSSFGAAGNGVVKTDFSSGSLDAGEAVALQEADGKIVVAGHTYNPNNTAPGVDFALTRYDANGNLDGSFDGDGKAVTHFGSGGDHAKDVAVQEDGKIVAFGSALNGSNQDFALARYNPNGSLDGGFDFDGKVMTDFGGGWESANGNLALQDDGRIVTVGDSGGDLLLARYNRDGSPNNALDNDGRLKIDVGGSSDEGWAVAVQEDAKIVAAGNAFNTTSSWDLALVRFFGGNDDTPPNVKPPVQSLVTGSTLGKSAAPIKLNWSATDLHGEVTGYQLQQKKDGGSYANVKLPSETATTVNRPGVFGSFYRYRVRATDDNGNRSFWKYGPTFSVDLHQETSDTITYSGTWKNQSITSASGGALKYSTTKDSTAKLTFTGRNVAWVSPKATNRGKAEVYLDGKKVATVDLYSSKALARKVVYSASGLDPSVSHTLEVKVLGTKRAASSGTRVDVDAFVVLR